ncbi:uncharacterized protein BDV14DRAFT_200450 [Aspergillus stella-maris]|uniref:uncharacterized protein n=1 Tax=Aspergillus stella-maris TaxID=1810926 RepID=UPI003CCDD2F0
MVSSIQNWDWRETTPGTYKRALDECETFYRACMRPESSCYPITGCASFTYLEHLERSSSSESTKGRDALNSASAIEEAFRKAWFSLRFEHPSLASWVEAEGEGTQEAGQLVRVYSNITADAQTQSEELDLWLSKTFSVTTIDGPNGAEEWFKKNALGFENSSIYLIHQDEVSSNDTKEYDKGAKMSKIFLRCSYDITDGIGTLHLLQQLFDYAEKALEERDGFVMPTFGNEGACLSHCLRVAAGIPVCLLTALAIVLFQLQKPPADGHGNTRGSRYINYTMMNLRSYVQTPYNSPNHAAVANPPSLHGLWHLTYILLLVLIRRRQIYRG